MTRIATDAAPVNPAPEPPFGRLLLLFFVSGACGLVYEILWMRRLQLVFGATQLAIATVLAAFMAGLALGAALAPRFTRGRHALRAYAALELLVAAWALAFPALQAATVPIYRAVFDAETVAFWPLRILQLGIVSLLLIPPTAAMGATLPLLARFALSRISEAGGRTGLLYASNTFGAVTGTWLGGFVLLPLLGVTTTERIAAAGNVGVAVLAFVLARSQGDTSAAKADVLPRPPGLSIPLVLAGSGAVTMILEVAWSRVLCLVLGSSVYAFTTTLLAFLLGTAVGALLGSALALRQRLDPRAALGLAIAGAGLAAFGTHRLLPMLPFWYVDLYALTDGGTEFWFAELGLALLLMAPATVLLGMTFPFAVRAYAADVPRFDADVSKLYSANTLGAVAGSLLAGFALVPTLGLRTTLQIGVAVDLLLGVALLLAVRRRLALFVLALVALTVPLAPRWDPLLMSAGMYNYVNDISDYSHEAVRNFAVSDFELLFYEEGITSVVTVAKSLGTGNLWLANNGKVDASSHDDLPTQVLLAHVPFLFRDGLRRALVVGLASGITAGSVAAHDELEAIDVLEIEPAILRASRLFDRFSGAPLDDPRVRCLPNDARNHLVLSEDRYDLIVNEPSNPWISGVSNLFTEEFLKLGRSRLTESGVFVQWTQIYGMGPDDLRMLLRTFRSVFPHVLVASTIEYADIILVGSAAPLALDVASTARMFTTPRIRDDLARVDVHAPADLIATLLLDEPGVREAAREGDLNTDDNLRIEFSAPNFLHTRTADTNALLLYDAAAPPERLLDALSVPLSDKAAQLAALADAYSAAGHHLRGIIAWEQLALLVPSDPRPRQRIPELRRRHAEAEEQ